MVAPGNENAGQEDDRREARTKERRLWVGGVRTVDTRSPTYCCTEPADFTSADDGDRARDVVQDALADGAEEQAGEAATAT